MKEKNKTKASKNSETVVFKESLNKSKTEADEQFNTPLFQYTFK